MSRYRTSQASPTAAVNWIDLLAASEVLENVVGTRFMIKATQASRVAPGEADPTTGTTQGIAMAAEEWVAVGLGSQAAVQSIWVQTPADQTATVFEISVVGNHRGVEVHV